MKLKIAVSMLLMSTIILAFMALLPISAGPVIPTTGTFEKYGPRVDHLIFKVAGDLAKETDLLGKGQIDVMDWAAPGSVIDDWLADPDITLGDYSEFGWYEFDLNLQMWPIGHGSMRPEQGAAGGAKMPLEADWDFPPTWDEGHYWINYTCQRCLDARDFRRAIAHLVDRSAGACVPSRVGANMETFIFPAISSWENPDAPKYKYNTTRADELLYNAGFRDYNKDGELEYSKSHAPVGATPPADMEKLPDIQLWIRTDDPDRKHAGELLRDAMLLRGIPVDAYVTSRTICYYHAWTLYDYHIYTGGWSWGRVPDMYFELWHSSKDTYPMTNGDGYNRYHSQEYDEWAMKLKTAANTTEALQAVFKCQEILHRDVGCIPLYTFKGFLAHRTFYPSTAEIPDLPVEEQRYSGRNWTGFVNEKGYSFYGGPVGFSGRNAHPLGFDKGGTLRHGLLIDVVKFDPVDAEWFYDWLVLDYVYEPLITYHPYNVTAFVPWLAKSYTVGTWAGPTGPASKVTFEIVPDILWQDNVPFTPLDAGYTYWYYKEAISVPHSWAVTNFDHYDCNATHVTLYFNVKSWLVLDWCVLPIIPWHIWKNIPPTKPGDPTPGGSWAYDPEKENTVIGTGPFRFYKDKVVGKVDKVAGQYIHLEANPTYFRKVVWPDVCEKTHTAGVVDNWVDLDDIMEVAKPGNIFAEENYDGTWPGTYDPITNPTGTLPGAWGEHCDVNKNGVIEIADIMECGVHLAEPWPAPWY